MVLADGGVVCIDEFDKVSSASVLSVTERVGETQVKHSIEAYFPVCLSSIIFEIVVTNS